MGEILRPEVLSISEFEKKRSLMGGMLQMESRIYLQETRRMKDDRALEELVHTTIVCSTNFARVTCGKQESQLQENTLYYSARIRGNEKLLLMSLSWKASDWKGGIHLVLNTEDIVIGSNLLQFLKRQMETVVNELAEYGK